MITERIEAIKHGPVELISGPQGAKDVTKLEAVAFNGDGEDIFTIATLGKIGQVWGVRDEKGQLIGAIEVFRQMDPKKGFIHGVIIDPVRQCKGLGTGLVEHAEQEAWKLGMSVMECTIAPTNGASLCTFLNHSGYSATKYLPDCYGDGGHRLWVTKDLGKVNRHFNYQEMVQKQSQGGSVYFVEEDNYAGIKELLSKEGFEIIGVVKPSESGQTKNLLCAIDTQAVTR